MDWQHQLFMIRNGYVS